MKFGRNLPRNQVPEWDLNYIKYKNLKKLIKSAASSSHSAAGPESGDTDKDVVDTAEFFYSLDRNLEDVDNFYNRKYGEATRRLKLLHDRYGRYAAGTSVSSHTLDKEDFEDLMGALLELRGLLRKIQWYGEVNRRGFVKITKKLDKKVSGSHATQHRYIETKVDTKQFATNVKLNETMKLVNDWLSRTTEVKIRDDSDAHSTHSSSSTLHRVSSGTSLQLPDEMLDEFEQAAKTDDSTRLLELLRNMEAYQNNNEASLLAQIGPSLLQRAISCRSRKVIVELLARLEHLEEPNDLNQRNCFHRIIIALGRRNTASNGVPEDHVIGNFAGKDMMVNGVNYLKPAAAPILAPHPSIRKEADRALDIDHDAGTTEMLTFLLTNLRECQRLSLQHKDIYGRMPLHYAAQYGFAPICQILIEQMHQWGLYAVGEQYDPVFWQDVDRLTPLHLAVMGGHPRTTSILLGKDTKDGKSVDGVAFRKTHSQSGELVSLAVKANFVIIVDLLCRAGVEVDYQDEQGETALHIASRYGHTECARTLVSGAASSPANMELVEKTFGWTPLHVAAVDGHLGVVEVLIHAGAILDIGDMSGWTALEHAALRGHIGIAQAIASVVPTPVMSQINCTGITASDTPAASKSLVDRCSTTNINGNSNAVQQKKDLIKSFGHRYLTKDTMILVSLGSMDQRRAAEAVNLERIPLATAHSTQLDTALSIIVSAAGAVGEPCIVDLPEQDNISTDPFVFSTGDASNVKLMFDIVPTYSGSSDRIIGRGVALLSSIRPSIGSKRISLQGDVTVPILASQTMEVIGSVNFNFLVITPFSHPNMTIAEDLTYWKSLSSTMVIGHRGLGKNTSDRGSLQLGENTLQSFIAAANLGAQYVEFDVQLTKDHVPVIYHDFLVSETGIDAPVHTLTLEQFLHINDTNHSARPSRPPSPSRTDNGTIDPVSNDRAPSPSKAGISDVAEPSRKIRSLSLSSVSDSVATSMSERMKHTRDFKAKGFKGNSRGNSIQAPFTTLEEMFRTLPQSIGFNIEMKYPMLFESQEQEMDIYAVELNSFVDAVLTKVYDLGKKRNIIFSSFNPDVCLLLSFKQPSIPILFLTDAGTSPVGDIRASSLQEAIRFASRWNLLGVVSEATPLILAPRLVKVVKESGLVCVSYGSVNNKPEKVKMQVREGIDAVIVDNVLAIRKGLTEDGA